MVKPIFLGLDEKFLHLLVRVAQPRTSGILSMMGIARDGEPTYDVV